MPISTSHIFSNDEKSLLDITIDLGNPITYPSFFLGKIKPALSDRLKLKL